MELGTIVVTGANGQVGQQLLSSLKGKCKATIALVRNPVNLPATEVITDWMNSPKAQEAIAQANAVVHLAGTLKPAQSDYFSANIKTTEALLSAINEEQTKRIVFLSYVGASEDSSNLYLSTKAHTERILQASGIPSTIFRCTHIIGSPDKPGPTAASLLSKNDKPVAVLGSGNQRVAPIYLDDVISAIIAALTQSNDGVFDLAGLECFTINDLVKLLNRSQNIKIRHLPPSLAKLLPWFVRDLPSALVDIMLADSIGNPQPVVREFNLNLTLLRKVWAVT